METHSSTLAWRIPWREGSGRLQSMVSQRVGHDWATSLLLGRKVMTNIDSLLKTRDITLSTKVHLVKAMIFPVVLYGCESWTIKKAEHQRIDAFELWCWRRLLRVPWTATRFNQSILKECSLEGLGVHWKDWCWSWNSNTLATWCEELTHLKRPWCWERLRARGEGDNRGWDGWMASLTQWTWIWVDSGSWWWTGGLACCSSWGRKESDMTERLNWITLFSISTPLGIKTTLRLCVATFRFIWFFSTPFSCLSYSI